MERSYLICMLVGWFTAKKPDIKADDLRIQIDQSLTDSKLTTLGSEPNDVQLLEELLGETMISVLGKGINRETRRKHGVINTK